MTTKIINGFPDYTINTEGQVWSNKSNKFLKPRITKQGYKQFSLTPPEGKIKQKYSHRLVGEAFIPNPDNLPTIDHINRHRFNNRVSNLRWASSKTQSQNSGMRHTNKSGHTYISYNKYHKKWYVQIYRDKKRIFNYSSKDKIKCLCAKFVWIILDTRHQRQNFLNTI